MKTIYKYPISIKDIQTIKLPLDAQIRCVMVDQKDDAPYIYVEVNNDNLLEDRTFEIFGTGHSIYEDMGVNRIYLGSFQVSGGEFIGHVYERLS